MVCITSCLVEKVVWVKVLLTESVWLFTKGKQFLKVLAVCSRSP